MFADVFDEHVLPAELTPESEVVTALVWVESFLEHVVDSLFLGPLQTPTSPFDLVPFSILQRHEYTVLEGSFEGEFVAG